MFFTNIFFEIVNIVYVRLLLIINFRENSERTSTPDSFLELKKLSSLVRICPSDISLLYVCDH